MYLKNGNDTTRNKNKTGVAVYTDHFKYRK